MARGKQEDTTQWPDEGTPEYEAFIAGKGQEIEKAGKGREITLHMPGQSEAVVLTNEQLQSLSFDQLTELATPVDSTEALGSDQFAPILEDKDKLIGVPFVILSWTLNEGGKFGGFVTLYVLTENNERYIVNDGSTGIRDQLMRYTDETGIDSMLVCRHGLRVSVYDKELPNGVTISDAKTYYIDTKL